MFGVSRQAIYQRVKRKHQREIQLAPIKELVLGVRRQMPRLGTRKLYFLLKDQLVNAEIKIGRDGLFTYLREQNMLVKPLKRYTKTTNSKHWLKKYPNLLLDQKVTRPEQYFVSDITYVKSMKSVHYLSLVTDAFSRKIMGYHLSNDMMAENVVKAFKKAVKNRLSALKLIHHSDRGLQYCSSIYQHELIKNNITPSMTNGYDCYQNALAERVNGILKQEFLINKCNTAEELEQLIKESINIYNNERPHLSLNLKTPSFIHEKALEEYSQSLKN